MESWNDIVQTCAGESHTVGLKSYGTVVAAGFNDNGACDVSDWSDIVQISVKGWQTVGTKSDGPVKAVGKNKGQRTAVE